MQKNQQIEWNWKKRVKKMSKKSFDDSPADCMSEEKKFDRQKKELLKQLKVLGKSRLNFTEEKGMELIMQ